MSCYQHTIAFPVTCSGVGLHSGKVVNLTIKPAPVNHGIKFVRVDLPEKPEIKANFKNVVKTKLSTVIGINGYTVSTIEHLMASFVGMSIDNAIVEIDAYEVPIMDGSAKSFVSLIYKSGIKKQKRKKFFFGLKKPIALIDGKRFVIMYPSFNYSISCTIEYTHSLIAKQTFLFDFNLHSFCNKISNARTFGFFEEIKSMKRNGFAIGGSLKNALVLNNNTILNKEGLRYKNEFVRHKILDCIGDFSLIGFPILGHIVAVKSGHKFNYEFVSKFFASKAVWYPINM